MKVGLKFLVAGAMVLVAAMGMAQNGGGGRQRGGQFGRVPEYGVQLLFRSDVQSDLKLTDEQKTKLTDLRSSMRGQRGGGGGGGGAAGGGGGNRQPMSEEAIAARRAEQAKQVNELLTPEQQKRFKEVVIQLAGPQAILNPEVQKDLGLTDAQKTKVTDLQKTYREASQAIREKMRNQEIDRERAQEANKTNTDTLKAELQKVLTPEQAEKLKSLGGAPFKADEQTRG